MPETENPVRLTCIIPVRNERESLETLVAEIQTALRGTGHRILFIDDGSTDGTRDTLQKLHETQPNVDAIRFRRNFGKTAALAAGFAESDTPYIVTLDGDLQDDPAEIPALMAKLQEGYDIVVGWKRNRQDPWHKVWPSLVYNKIVSRVFGLALHDVNSGLKLYRAEAAKSLRLHGNLHRLIPVLAAGLGYKLAEVPVHHRPRRHGKSKYGMSRFMYGALDLMTLYFVQKYGQAPSHFYGKWGLFAAAVGFLVLVAGLVALAMNSIAIGLILMFLGVVYAVSGKFMVFMGWLGELQVYRAEPPDTGQYIAETLKRK